MKYLGFLILRGLWGISLYIGYFSGNATKICIAVEYNLHCSEVVRNNLCIYFLLYKEIETQN